MSQMRYNTSPPNATQANGLGNDSVASQPASSMLASSSPGEDPAGTQTLAIALGCSIGGECGPMVAFGWLLVV